MSGDVGASLFTSHNTSEAYDPADNGLSAIPQFDRWTFNPQLFFEGENSELRVGLSAVVEDRLGGGIDYIEGRRDVPGYYEDSSTERLSTSTISHGCRALWGSGGRAPVGQWHGGVLRDFREGFERQ